MSNKKLMDKAIGITRFKDILKRINQDNRRYKYHNEM